MIVSSGRNVTLLLIIMWAMFMSGFKSGVEGINKFPETGVFVTIRNDLTSALALSCRSFDEGLSNIVKTLKANEQFYFSFKPNFYGTTKHVCDFAWDYNLKHQTRQFSALLL
jgi:hypothetical protein